jgi:hypothetical protein
MLVSLPVDRVRHPPTPIFGRHGSAIGPGASPVATWRAALGAGQSAEIEEKRFCPSTDRENSPDDPQIIGAI